MNLSWLLGLISYGVICGSLFGCAARSTIDCGGNVGNPFIHAQVVSIGWHTGIVLPRALIPKTILPETENLPLSDHLEFGWGDAAYYPHPDPPLWLALKAVLTTNSSVVQIVGIKGRVEEFFLGAELITLPLSEKGAERLFSALSASIDREGNRVAPILQRTPHYPDGFFFRAHGRFHLFNTCNTWVARILNETGCEISWPLPVTSGGLMTRVRVLSDGQ